MASGEPCIGVDGKWYDEDGHEVVLPSNVKRVRLPISEASRRYIGGRHEIAGLMPKQPYWLDEVFVDNLKRFWAKYEDCSAAPDYLAATRDIARGG